MKKLAITLLFAAFAVVSFAQVTVVATLQHEGALSHFTGVNAFITAYNASVDGDIITLSAGTFYAPNTIEKGITVHGNGIGDIDKTYISGAIKLYSTLKGRTAVFEGVEFKSETNIYNATDSEQGTIKFIKCKFVAINTPAGESFSTERGPIVRLFNCIVPDVEFTANSYPYFMFQNCLVNDPHCVKSVSFSENLTTFINCNIVWEDKYLRASSGGYWSTYYACSEYASYFSFINCIFYNLFTSNYRMYYDYKTTPLPSTSIAISSLSVGQTDLFSNLAYNSNNQVIDLISDVFKTFAGSFTYDENFELTDDAKTKYIGTDGTQIGMQGGTYPYSLNVSYPIITTFKTDAKTTKDGILRIEVKTDETK